MEFIYQSWTSPVEKTEQWTAGPDDMAAHCNLQRTSGIIAEEGKKNKLERYHSQTMTANICANGDSKFNYVNQWTLEGDPYPWISKIDSISKLAKALGQNPHRMSHIRNPGLILDGRSPSLGTGVLWKAGYGFFLYGPPSPRYRKKQQKSWKP